MDLTKKTALTCFALAAALGCGVPREKSYKFVITPSMVNPPLTTSTTNITELGVYKGSNLRPTDQPLNQILEYAHLDFPHDLVIETFWQDRGLDSATFSLNFKATSASMQTIFSAWKPDLKDFSRTDIDRFADDNFMRPFLTEDYLEYKRYFIGDMWDVEHKFMLVLIRDFPASSQSQALVIFHVP